MTVLDFKPKVLPGISSGVIVDPTSSVAIDLDAVEPLPPDLQEAIDQQLSVPLTRMAYLKAMKGWLSEDDYLEMLEGIACYEIFKTQDAEIQDIVTGFHNLKRCV